MTAEQLIESVAQGGDPTKLVREAINENVSGPERQDISPDQKMAMFQQLIQQSEVQVPYLNHEYVDQVLMQLQQGAPAQEMIALAAANRDQYAQSHNIGSPEFATWDAIHRSLTATYTDQLPPQPTY